MSIKAWGLGAAISIGLLACGGGGGGASGDGGTPGAASGGVTLSGMAAKGALASARVEVHALKAGAVDAAVLASSLTAADGSYQLPPFDAQADLQYVVLVKAQADGSTTQLDEATATRQPLPADFTLRAFVPAFDSSQGAALPRLHVSPFSELAVAAAQKSQYTPASIAQAVSNVQQLIGFDPRSVLPMTIDEAAASTDSPTKANHQRLAVLLMAVSELAHDGALGCTSSDPGHRTACIIDALAASYTVNNTKPADAVATALAAAIDSIATTHASQVPRSLLSTLLANLTDDSGQPALINNADPIPVAKLLFDELRTDVIATVGGGRGASTNFMQETQRRLFDSALETVQAPLTMAVKDVDALLLGIKLFQSVGVDADGDPLTYDNLHGQLPDNLDGSADAAVHCAFVQDGAGTMPSTSLGNAVYVACDSRFVKHYNDNVDGQPVATDVIGHRFVLEPLGANKFSYVAHSYIQQGGALPVSLDGAGAGAGFAGIVQLILIFPNTWSLRFSGELPPNITQTANGDWYRWDGSNRWALQARRTIVDPTAPSVFDVNSEVDMLDGRIERYAAAGGVVDSALTIKPGSQVTLVDGRVDEGDVQFLWSDAISEIEGQFGAANSAVDLHGKNRRPMDVWFSGSLRSGENSLAMTEFASGMVAAHITPESWAAYDSTSPPARDNQYDTELSFAGALTAPTRPLLKLTAAFMTKSFDKALTGFTAQYKTIAPDGSTRHVLAIDGSSAQGLSFSEASSGLAFSIVPNAPITDVTLQGIKIGVLDRGQHRVTFTNGDFVSVDLGL